MAPCMTVSEVNSDPGTFHYWAFISYSQRDAAWAARLHDFLERYRLPRSLIGRQAKGQHIPSRLMPIFRDRDELAGSPDLSKSLQQSLAASASLVVICSRHAAASTWVNEEVRTYKTLGHSERVLAMIVPEEGRPTELDVRPLFPKALLHNVKPDGTISEREIEPMAADVRSGKDSWNDACLKIVAGILGIRFDDLRRRDLKRRRRAAAIRAAATISAGLLAALAFVLLADWGAVLPGAEPIRRVLDHYGMTIFRPLATEQQRHRAALAMRGKLRERLVAGIQEQGIDRMKDPSAWTIGQISSALLNDPDLPVRDKRRLLPMLDRLFAAPDGETLLSTRDDVGNRGRLEPIVWTIIALAEAVQSGALTEAERGRFDEHLQLAEGIAERFHLFGDGGWNTYAQQADPKRHFTYTTALALYMLLQLRDAGEGWRGDRDRLRKMIADTARWLAESFVDDRDASGWRRSLDDEKQPDAGLTLFVYSALGSACEADIKLPGAVIANAVRVEAGLRNRAFDYADPDIRFDIEVGSRNDPTRLVSTTRMIWYPRAINGLVAWRACARRHQLPPEIRRALIRSLDHLMIDLSPLVLADVTRRTKPLYVDAEVYYGIGAME